MLVSSAFAVYVNKKGRIIVIGNANFFVHMVSSLDKCIK